MTRIDPPPAAPRLVSLDALRGFDMFIIIGGERLIAVASEWIAKKWPAWQGTHERLELQLEHVEWQGFRFYDLIFPLFLFLVGAVIPFSLAKVATAPGAAYRRIVGRTIFLSVLGLLYNHILNFDFANTRYTGVLQRLAVGYFFAAMIVYHVGPRVQLFLFAAILIGYWAIFAYVPMPGGHPGDYRINTNICDYLDRQYLPGTLMPAYHEYGDNEGLLSMLPAVATALLGALAGQWLRADTSPGRKIRGLVVASAACLALGYTWTGFHLAPFGTATDDDIAHCVWTVPVVKNVWSSSFVLIAGGWSLLLLALFYGVIDVWGLKRWAYFFVVIGANALTIYMLQSIVEFDEKPVEFFFKGLKSLADEDFRPVVTALADVAVKWLLLWVLYRNRLFLRA